jgi:eukaryotic-like serine/threonine-protein kinase
VSVRADSVKTIGGFAGYSPAASMGPFGETDLYLADPGRVVLKHLPRTRRGYLATRDRLIEEARIAELLVHPAFLPFLESGEDRSGFTLAYRLEHGPSLWRVAHTLGRQELLLPHELAVHIVRLLARATSFVHREHDLVIRELSADNVILAKDGQVFVATHRLDLGHPERERSFEDAGHLAPECIARSEYSVASDVYALGAMLFTLLSGRQPPAGSAIPLEEMLGAPQALVEIVAGATHPLPDERYGDPRRLAIELDAFLGEPIGEGDLAQYLVQNRLL